MALKTKRPSELFFLHFMLDTGTRKELADKKTDTKPLTSMAMSQIHNMC